MAKANLELARAKATGERLILGISDYECVDIFKLLRFNEKVNIIKTHFEEGFSGTVIEKGKIKLILLNSKMSLGRQNFTLAHELYHLKYDLLNNGNLVIEKEADEFASHFLMPESALDKQLLERGCFTNGITIEDVIYLEQYFMMSHTALLRRLKNKKIIQKQEIEKFGDINIKEVAYSLGYPLDLYNSTNEELKIYSELPEVAKKLLDEEKITNGKYEGYLIESGYGDIVFGLEEDDFDE